ncbi:MAG: PAS domain S-box-containing protein [Marivirga sp.]
MNYFKKNGPKHSLKSTTEKLVMAICLLLSSAIIIGWYYNGNDFLSLSLSGAIMKVNTALIFLLVGINMMIWRMKGRYRLLYKGLSIMLLLIGILTLLEYLGIAVIQIDNLFVVDTVSINMPGRISPGTAICSILMGIAFLGLSSEHKLLKSTGYYAGFIVAFISLLAIIAYFLSIPSTNNIYLSQTIAIHTSLLFFLSSIVLVLKNNHSTLSQMLSGKLSGSKIFRGLFPLIILFPILLSYLLLKGINRGIISLEFGIVVFAGMSILLSFIYISFVAVGLNDADNTRSLLESGIKESTRDLKLFKHALDQVSIVAITDKNGVIKYVNDKFCEISQYDRQALIGNTHRVINSAYHKKEFFITLWKTIASGEIWVGEVKNKAKDGTFYWVHTAIVPFKDAQGEVTEYLAIRQDITQRKAAEDLLRSKYVETLELKNKELEQFAYTASHDLKSPINTIIGLTELLEKESSNKLDEMNLKYLAHIKDSSSRMKHVIKDLLEYARIDQAHILTTVDCNKLIQEIKYDLAKKIADTSALISVSKLPSVQGYETPLRLLFQNLISNALKFCETAKAPHINISAQLEQNKWHFSIEDNGIGIATEHLKQVFIIFKRLHDKNSFEGTGIGLAHCKKVADLHQGKIWVNSELGKGSTFHIELPI